MNSVWKPISPRDGMMKSRRTRPLPSGTMLVMSPRRSPSFSMMVPWCCSSTSTVTASYGSCLTPSTSLMTTSGRATASSYPSRRMFSMRMPRCSSPRPETLNLSGSSPSSTRRATLCLSSSCRRSRSTREVTYLPSRPANGEVLTWKVMLTVGSSTVSGSIASTWFGSHRVSEMNSLSIPVKVMMSPARASSTSTRSRPWKPMICSMRPLRTPPLRSTTLTGVFGLMRPRFTRPMPIRP